MTKSTFFTLTVTGAVEVTGYKTKDFGFYKSKAYWRAIHLCTGLMVAQETTLKAAAVSAEGKQNYVSAFMDNQGSEAKERFQKAVLEYCCREYGQPQSLPTAQTCGTIHRERSCQ